VALAPFDWQAHDTYFVVAHLHYVLIGGMLFPVVAGIYYFFPFMTGKRLSDRLGRIAFWPMFVGFNLGFLPMHLTGLRGMPRRVFTYPEGLGWDWLNLMSTVGAFIFAAGLVVVVLDVLRPKGRQPYAERNPWNAGTLEWLTEIPGKPWGARTVPLIESRYPLWDQKDLLRDYDDGRFFLPDAEEGLRETLVTSTLDAEPEQCLRVPGPTFLTMLAAIFTGGAFIFPTFHMYVAGLVSAAIALCFVLAWLWTGTAMIPEKTHKDVGRGLTLPLYASGPNSVGWWAMFITMLGDVSAFAGLVFGYFFYWTIHDDFPPEPAPALGWPLLALAALFGAWLLTFMAPRWNRRGHAAALRWALAGAAVFATGGGAALLAGPWFAGLDPTAHVYPAIVWILIIWTTLHVAAGIVMQLYCIAGSLAGRLMPQYDIDIWNVALYWHFLIVTAAVTVAVVAGFPKVS
jgi:cytochrome c oxidase subunit I+III